MTDIRNNNKIIIIGPAYPLRGGIANLNEALCCALNKQGKEAKIISFSLQYPSILFPGKTQYESGAAPADLTIETKINSINPFNWFKVANQIIKEKPEYVIIRYWLPFMAPCLGTIAKKIKNAGIKVIAITDNVIPHEKRPGDKLLTGYFVRNCSAFVAMSRAVLKDLEEFTDNSNKIFLPHPIYDIFGNRTDKKTAAEKLGLDVNGNYILFFGFIRKYKGLDLLLQAMGDTRIKNLDVKLIVAGEFYEDEQPYLEQINKLNIEKNVILKKTYIPSDEVKYYFSISDLIAQPYRSATQSGVTQIAYHFEKPMLVTDTGGLAEIVPHGKCGYVTDINAETIADAIVDFYTHKRGPVFEQNIKEEKKRFQWEYFVDGIEKLFRQLK